MTEAIALMLLVLFGTLGLKKPGIAVVWVIGMCAALFIWAVSTELESTLFLTMLYIPVLFVVTMAAVLLAGRGQEEPEWPQRWAKGLLIAFLGLLICVTGTVLLTNLAGTGLLILIIFFAVVFLIGGSIYYNATSTRSVTTDVVSTLGSSIEQHLPLPMALEAAGAGRSGKSGRAIRSIRRWLVQGHSLSESVKRGYPRCPAHVVAMIDVAERSNQLAEALASLRKDMAARAAEDKKVRPGGVFYPIALLLILTIVTLHIFTFVLPSFTEIMTEITDGVLPAPTRLLRDVGRFILFDYGWLFLMAVFLAGFSVLVSRMRRRFRPRQPGEPGLLARMADWVKWYLPIWHWFERNYSLARTIEVLRLSLRADARIDRAISNTLEMDVNARFRERLSRWLNGVEQGQSVSDSAKRCGLGAPLAWAFDEQVNPGNTVTVLEALESFYRSNYSYRVNLARFVLWPCLTICMALAVGFVVYAIFSVPVEIIHRMAEIVYP